MSTLSPRLAAAVDALPLATGLRVVEIGCGPGAAAREVARRVGPSGHVLAVDRSARAAAAVRRTCAAELASGSMSVRQVAGEDLVLAEGEERYDVAFAVRVGALDGRHPELGERIHARLAAVLVDGVVATRTGELVVWSRRRDP